MGHSTGIDWGRGHTNIDKEAGVRYGVIQANVVGQSWYDGSGADYGDPHCPECGNEAVAGDSDMESIDILEMCADNGIEFTGDDMSRDALGYETLHHACGDYACDSCRLLFDGEDAFGDIPNAWYVGALDENEKLIPDSDGYLATQGGDDCDIFILKSPYYTRAAYCSPCAPGACYLASPCDDGDKAYCFGADWFDTESPCPYPIYRVDNDELVYTPKAGVKDEGH